MSSKQYFKLLATILPLLSCTQEKKQQPNLLFIFTEQQTDKTLEVYGNNQFIVPNLNKLAKESVVFMNTYVACPVSSPSRGAIMTGLYPQAHGAISNNIPLLQSAKTLPELVNTDGQYTTAYMGKWHLGDEAFAQHGFSEWVSTEDGYAKFFSTNRDPSEKTSYYKFLQAQGLPVEEHIKGLRNYVTTLPYEQSKPQFLANNACAFLEKNKAHPFILYVNYLEPHSPFSGPFNDLLKNDSLTLNDNIGCILGHDDPLRYMMKTNNKNSNAAKFLSIKRRYAGLCYEVDLSVGQILGKLKELGLMDNTIIVFTSDHGEMMGSHGLSGKGVMFEEAMRVPLLMHIPELYKKGQIKVNTPVCNVDIVPTLLDLMGRSSQKEGLQGESLLPMIQGNEPELRYIFLVWNPNNLEEKKAVPKSFKNMNSEEIKKYFWASFRTVISSDGWKLTLSDVDKNQLFNLNEDRGECNNLYYTGKYGDYIKHLSEQIAAWQKRTGDTLMLKM